MQLRWFTVLLCTVAWRTTCEAVKLREVYNSTSNNSSFCVTVSDQEPANLTRDERLFWKSNPTVSIQLYVFVTRLYEYTTCASQRELDKDLLTLGTHNVEYREDVNVTTGIMFVAVTVDGHALEPQLCSEPIYATAAHFEHIKVFAKGPLHFNWTDTCPETTRAPSTLPMTTTTEYSTELRDPLRPIRSTHNTRTPIDNTSLLLTYNTANPVSVTTAPSVAKGIPFWTWIIAGAVIVAVVVVAVSCCYALARRRTHKKQMKRRTDAERVKQQLLVDAKRMSYQEQMRWDMGRVDAAAVPASQEFSYNMTTFTDQAN